MATVTFPTTPNPSLCAGPVPRLASGDMKYAINVPAFTDSATVIDWARRAERAEWDGFFVWDHVQWLEALHRWIPGSRWAPSPR